MKLNHKEFRVGNLVEYDGRVFEIDSVSEVLPTLNTIEFGIGVVDWNNLKPIPLNEDWLVRLGFISNHYFDRYEKDSFHIEHDATQGYSQFWNSRAGVTFKTVHHLQNYYHALTGTELTLTDK